MQCCLHFSKFSLLDLSPSPLATKSQGLNKVYIYVLILLL